MTNKKSTYNENGEEILDPTPIEIPLHFQRPMSLNERIKQMVQHEASMIARANGYETFSEADDFNVDDDEIDPSSPWEENFDPEVPFIAAREAEIRHGQVSNYDENKIKNGAAELHKLRKKTSPKAKSSSGDEQLLSSEKENKQ